MNKYALVETIKKLREGVSNSLGGTNGARIAADSILTGSAAFTLAALARIIAQQKEADHDYADVDVAKYVDMSVNDPIIDKDHVNELTGQTKRAFNTKDLTRWSIPAASGILAGTLGHIVVDRIYDRSTGDKLKEDEAVLADLTKKVTLARALNARGMLSDESYNELIAQVQPYMGKKASEDNPVVMPALGLVLALAFAMSAYGSYHYDAARSPARNKYKAIKSGLKQYAMQNGGMYPVDRGLVDSAKALEDLERSKKDISIASPTETPMTLNPVTI